MSDPTALARSLLVWLVPFAIVVAALGFETDWGRCGKRDAPAAPATPPQPVAVALLPEYRIDGGLDARQETVDRVLFNPTRRPAPPATQTAGPNATMKQGLYHADRHDGRRQRCHGVSARSQRRQIAGRQARRNAERHAGRRSEIGSGAPEAGGRCRGSPVEGRHRAEDNHPDGARRRGAGRSGCAGQPAAAGAAPPAAPSAGGSGAGGAGAGARAGSRTPDSAADAASGAAACCARHAGASGTVSVGQLLAERRRAARAAAEAAAGQSPATPGQPQ